MQAFVQELKRQLQPTKPLDRAEGLERMADKGLKLTAAELSDLLKYNVTKRFDGKTRFGYRFEREKNNDDSNISWLWRCQRC